MNIIQRVRDLCAANVHLTLDRLEDPEAMLGQAIREMEAELADALQAAASLIALEKLTARRVAEQQSGALAWERKARHELAAGHDGKARRALQRKLECNRALPGLREQLSLIEENRLALRRQIATMSEKLAEARRMRSALAARQFAASVRENSRSLRTGVGFARFEQIRDRVEHAEAVADAWLTLDDPRDGERTVGDELSPEEVDEQLDAELECLRQAVEPRAAESSPAS